MKYIDAEKLKAEIERRRLQNRYIDTDGYEQELFEIIDSLQQEQPSEICSKCIHHGKDDGYCYNPYGGMQSLVNENGVYECTGFCEQERQEVDLKQEIKEWVNLMVGASFPEQDGDFISEEDYRSVIRQTALHFYELGKNSK